MTDKDSMKRVKFTRDVSKKLNELAREEMKHKLLNDILIDMTICKLEGWDIMDYLLDINKLLSSIINKQKSVINNAKHK